MTARKAPTAANSTASRAVRDAAVDAGLDQVRAGQPGERVEHDEHQAEQQRAAELAQQPEQAERRGRGRVSAARSSVGAVAHRRQRLDLGEQLRRGGSGESTLPAAAATAAEPGAERRAADGRGPVPAGGAVGARHADAVTPPAVSSASASMRSPAARSGSLLEAGQQPAVERAARGQLLVRALVDDPAAVEHDDPVGQVQGRDAGARSAAWCGRRARRAGRRGSPPRCGRRRRWWRRRGRGSRGSARIARASATRCRCPPDRVSPRSPTTVS